MELLIRRVERRENREKLVSQYGEEDVLEAEDWAKERREFLEMEAKGQIKFRKKGEWIASL